MKRATPEIKLALLAAVREELIRVQATAESGAVEAHKDTLEAEGRMKTRYDSTRTERAWLADAQKRRTDEIGVEVIILDKFTLPDSASIIDVGHLVQLMFGDEALWYFVLPVGGGIVIESEELESKITIITMTAPLYAQLDGKRIGSGVQIEGKDFTIIQIV